MNKIIQICGANGSGKTTAVRSFIKQNNFTEIEIKTDFSGGKYKALTNNEKSIIILGDYKEGITCGGIDGKILHSDELLMVLKFVITRFSPSVILFEGVMFGKTVSIGTRINALSKRMGYEYVRITFFADLKILYERIQTRNGGKEINIDSLYNTYKSVISSAKKLRAQGVKIKIINVESNAIDYAKIITEEMK